MPTLPTNHRAKIWSSLLGSQCPHRVTHLRLSGSAIFADQSIELDRFTVLVGAHGSGKTVFLRALHTALGEWGGNIQFPPFTEAGWLDNELSTLGGTWEVAVDAGKVHRTVTVDLAADVKDRQAAWGKLGDTRMTGYFCSPVRAFDDLVMLYQSPRRAKEMVSKSEPDRLNQEDTRALGRILGRAYEEVEVYDFGDDIDLHGCFYVRARVGQTWFDSFTMSLGELWVHHVLNWVLRYAESNEVVLIDEPETFISPRGQPAFIDQIARYAVRNRLQVVVATHMPDAFRYLPVKHFRVCLPGPDGVKVVTPRSSAEVRQVVGVEVPLRGMVIVEDDMAARLLNCLFATFEPLLRKSVEVIAFDGVQQADRAARVLQRYSRLRCALVLDGDQRDQWQAAEDTLVLFLPGAHSPEQELFDAVRHRPEKVAERLGRRSDAMEVLDDTLRFAEHQAWWRLLSDRLGVEEPALFDAVVQVWLDEPLNNAIARDLVASLAHHIFP